MYFQFFISEAALFLKESVNIDDNIHVLKSEIESVHMASVLCDEHSTLFALSSLTTILVVVLKQHGILYDGLDMKSCQTALVQHFLYGHCHHCVSLSCQSVAKMSGTMSSLAVSLSSDVLGFYRQKRMTPAIFHDICTLLGFLKKPASLSVAEAEYIDFYEHCLAILHNPKAFYQLSKILNDYEDMDKCMLTNLCGVHGIPCDGFVDELCD